MAERWTPADRELVWAVLNDIDCHDDGAAEAVLDALADAGKLLPSDVEVKTRQKCKCGHHPSDHPAGARCMNGMTWTQPATCHCRGFVAALTQREWTEPWRSVKGDTDAR